MDANAIIAGALSGIAGAGLALVVAPWTDRRGRARERWEQDVLAFGRAFNEELPAIRWEAYLVWATWNANFEPPMLDMLHAGDEACIKEEQQDRRAAEAATEAYSALVSGRLNWLADRVASGGSVTDRFQQMWRAYRDRHPYTWQGWNEDVREEIQARWSRERDDWRTVNDALKALAGDIRPPKPLLRRRPTHPED